MCLGKCDPLHCLRLRGGKNTILNVHIHEQHGLLSSFLPISKKNPPLLYCRFSRRSLTWRRTLSSSRSAFRIRKHPCRWPRPGSPPVPVAPTLSLAEIPYSTGRLQNQSVNSKALWLCHIILNFHQNLVK